MKTYLGIELGSTRIKAVLIDGNAEVLAKGAFEWESRLTDGLWSYGMDEVQNGLQASFAELAKDYKAKTGEALTEVNLCLIVESEAKETERRLYRTLDTPMPCNYLVYAREEWEHLSSDPTSYAAGIRQNGVLLYGKA